MSRLSIKHILYSVLLFICVLLVSAQNKVLQVYKGGEIVQLINVSEIDSIKFANSDEVVKPDEEQGVVINGVRWATRNVGIPGQFVASQEDAGYFYQWNRIKGWNPDEPCTNWDSSIPLGDNWTTENSPCPKGWRLPTNEEMQSLIDAGSEWTTVNGIYGRKYGSGENSIFLPAGGLLSLDGTFGNYGSTGNYWTSTGYGNDKAYGLIEGSGTFVTVYASQKVGGSMIRCVADVPAEIEVKSIKLNTDHIKLKIGDTFQLEATVLPKNATSADVTWLSLDNTIATVDANGLITAIAQGECLIGAYAGNKHVGCTVTVYSSDKYDDGVIINGIKWATRNVGKPGEFTEHPEDFGMYYQWNRYPGWSTTDKSISIPEGCEWGKNDFDIADDLTGWELENSPCPKGWRIPTQTELESLVNSGYQKATQNGVNGYIFGKGENTIFIPSAGMKASDTGTIYNNYNSSGNYWGNTPNQNYKEHVSYLSFNEKNDPKVSVYGDIYDGFNIRCVADEYIPVKSITLNKTNLSLKLGTYETLTATILPDNASNKSVIWSCSDNSVATTNRGQIYAKAPGHATIIAQIDGQMATCELTVFGTVQTDLNLNKSRISLKVGESFNLIATVTPPDATYNSVTWKSGDTSIAIVDQSGKVTAVKEGTTLIYASTKSMSKSCSVIVNKTGGDGDEGSSTGDSGSVTGKTFSSAQLYYYGNLSSNTTYFRLSLFNINEYDGLVIEGFCDKAYSFDNFILDSGTYKFSATYGVAKTFIEGEYFGNPSESGHYMGSYYYRPSGLVLFNGGTVTVSKSGNTYTISTNLAGYSNSSTNTYKNLNFKYRGTPEKIDYFK